MTQSNQSAKCPLECVAQLYRQVKDLTLENNPSYTNLLQNEISTKTTNAPSNVSSKKPQNICLNAEWFFLSIFFFR